MIEKEIQNMREDISALVEIIRGKYVKDRKQLNLLKKHLKEGRDIPTNMEQLKRQVQAKAQHIKRFTKRNKFYHHNKLFKESAKKFCRELGKKSIEVKERPDMKEVEVFWSNIMLSYGCKDQLLVNKAILEGYQILKILKKSEQRKRMSQQHG